MEAVIGWGGPEAAKIFSQTSASAFENRSRKSLAVACEQNDITAALNIYVIKGCHQLWTEPSCGCFSPSLVLIFLGFIFRKWAGLSSYMRGTQGTSRQSCGRGSLRPRLGWGLGCAHAHAPWRSSSLLCERAGPRPGKVPGESAPSESWVPPPFTKGSPSAEPSQRAAEGARSPGDHGSPFIRMHFAAL